ncbi:MAG: flagellar biosynthetic protein FliR [Spirochaetaceae bacterium]|nr:flagellar biosynthetic protein FliR [Spirochaetaceae bacterium]
MYEWPSNDWNLFLLVAARILALVETAPLLSGQGVPQVAKLGLAGFAAAAVFPAVKAAGYPMPDDGAAYALLVLGEAMIGVIIGFFLSILYAAFVTAGQFFSLQIGFGASETFDPLAEVEIPLMGQYLNLMAMFAFISTNGFQKLFLVGVQGSFGAMRAIDLVARRQDMVQFLMRSTGALLQQALILAMPVLGTLFVISVAMGLMSKAAPQMNLLTEGFPLSLSAAYLLLLTSLPFLMEAFSRLIESGFGDLAILVGGTL